MKTVNAFEAWEATEEYVWCDALESAFWNAEWDGDEEASDFFFDWIEAIDPEWAKNMNDGGEDY